MIHGRLLDDMMARMPPEGAVNTRHDKRRQVVTMMERRDMDRVWSGYGQGTNP